MVKINLIILAVFLLIISCDNPTEIETYDDESNILDLVFRDQFYDDYSGFPLDQHTSDSIVKIYFIGIYEEVDSNYQFPNPPVDPSSKLINRLSNIIVPVKKVSNCIFIDCCEYRDKTTNERGIMFFAGPIRWNSESEVEVEAGYRFGGVSSHCLTYYVQKRNNDEWYIANRRERWGS